MSDNNICPLCGSGDISHELRQETVSDNFLGHKEISLAYDLCQECGMDGDFTNQNDALISEAISELKTETVKVILQDFTHNNVNFAGMERALELPQRTLAKWKSGASIPTSAGITLLKFLKLFPWLVDVADYNFDFDEGQRIHIKDAFNQMLPQMQFFQAYMQTNTKTSIELVVTEVQANVGFRELDIQQPQVPALAWSQFSSNDKQFDYVT